MAAERRLRRQLQNKHGESSPSEFNFPKHSASPKRTKPGIRKLGVSYNNGNFMNELYLSEEDHQA
jgi:hypothetical protein